MTIHFREGNRIVAVLASLLLSACGDSSTTPTQPSSPNLTAGSSSARVVRLVVTAPDSVAPQQSAQLRATAVRADGTTQDVTAQAQWASADADLLQVSRDGVVTGMRVGEVTVTATYQATETHYGSAPVVVLFPGTYKLSGWIVDSGTAVAGVSVTAASAAGAGLTATSGVDGAFALYGVAGLVQLRAQKTGYLPLSEDVNVTQSTSRTLQIVPDRQRLDLSGTYVLMLGLGTCDTRSHGVFADELQNRRYSATVTQDGPRLRVSLGGAEFITRNGRGDHFQGTVDPTGGVTFTIGKPDDWYLTEYPDLAERVGPAAAFLAFGTVTARATSTTVIGTTTGSIVISAADNPSFWSRTAWCYSEGHRFEMRRQ